MEEGDAAAVVGPDEFLGAMRQAISEFLGTAGNEIPLEMVKFENTKAIAGLVRVPLRSLSAIWSALSMFSAYGRKRCKFQVRRVSPFATAFAPQETSREQEQAYLSLLS